jgi:peroxiredoxin
MKLEIGKLVPAFQLKGIDGKQHSLSDLRGQHATVVIFSCNHCPYVRAWEGRLIALQRDFSAKGVRFIAINANDAKNYPEDSFDEMTKRAAEQGYNFPYLYDETQQTARAYEAERTPEVFVLDAQLKLRYHGAPDDHYEDPKGVTKRYLKDALDALLASREPSVKETPPVGCTIKWKKN